MSDEEAFTIECSNCAKPLSEVWALPPKDGSNPNKNVTIVVKCPWCVDKSWAKKTTGRFAFGDTVHSRIENVESKLDEDGNEHLMVMTGKGTE